MNELTHLGLGMSALYDLRAVKERLHGIIEMKGVADELEGTLQRLEAVCSRLWVDNKASIIPYEYLCTWMQSPTLKYAFISALQSDAFEFEAWQRLVEYDLKAFIVFCLGYEFWEDSDKSLLEALVRQA